MPDDYLDGLSAPRRAARWREWLSTGELDTWVAELDGSVVGFVGSSLARDADLPPATAELVMINVLQEHAGQGVGSALLATVEDTWRTMGVGRAVLWVLDSNERARSVYEHFGWSPDGARRDLDLGGAPVAEIRMAKLLV